MNNFLPAPRGDGERSQGLVETQGIAAKVRGKLPVAQTETLPAASQAARGGSGGKVWRPSSALSPLDAWIAVKTVLARELGEREEDMWIRHLRLMRVMNPFNHRPTLLVAMPRKGKVIFGTLRFYGSARNPGRIRKLVYKAGFHVALTVALDPEERRLALEYAATLDDGYDRADLRLGEFNRKQHLLDKYQEGHYTFEETAPSELWKEVGR